MPSINPGPASSSTVNQTAQLQLAQSAASLPTNAAILAQSAIPFILAPTGSIGANGAITLGTAMPVAYANAYIYLPAGAVFTGSGAGWYFLQMSSTTVGVVFGNAYVSGVPAIPASPTPFGTVGPGAYTGVLTVQSMVVLTIPGGVMGPNGTVRYTLSGSVPNNADNKAALISYAGTLLTSVTMTTSLTFLVQRSFSNRGVTGSQVNDGGLGIFGPQVNVGAAVYTTADTTQPQTLSIQGQLAVATDFVVLEKFLVEVIPG